MQTAGGAQGKIRGLLEAPDDLARGLASPARLEGPRPEGPRTFDTS